MIAFWLLAAAAALSISGNMHGSRLTIRTSQRNAGAIDSLTWRGKEFINTWDHGRELQSASSYDGYGECLNPTEAGSAPDGRGPTSSSRLVSSSAHHRTLRTTIEMAYWLAPGADYRRPCGSHQDFRRAKNETVRSSDRLIKQVRIENDVIDYDVTFVTAENHQSATFEALTGYMPPEFSEFLAFDPVNGRLVPLSDGPGEQPRPVVLSTPDHAYAMGIWAGGKAGFGRFRFPDTVKWNAVYRVSPAPKGRYSYHCFVAVGNLEEVRRTLQRLVTGSDKDRD